MRVLTLLWLELTHRRWAALVWTGVTAVSVALVIFFIAIADLAASRTRVIQRDLGLNLRLIPAGTDLDRYWIKGYADGAIDERLLERLVQQNVASRLVPMLQRTIPWGDSEAILTGVGDELFGGDGKKPPVFGSANQASGTIILGSAAAARRDVLEGQDLEVLGRRFRVDRVLASTGSVDDARIFGDLRIIQEMLGMPGQLNEIRAIECHCDADVLDPEAYLRSILEPLLPGTMLIRQDRMAEARRRQRHVAERVAGIAAPLMVVLAVIALAGLAFINAHQRRSELGLLISLGYSGWELAALLWLRAAIIGVVGGLFGVALAWIAVASMTPWILGGGPDLELDIQWLLIGASLGGTVSAIAAMVPAAWAARIDPASLLRES